jgi:hypothetical protein
VTAVTQQTRLASKTVLHLVYEPYPVHVQQASPPAPVRERPYKGRGDIVIGQQDPRELRWDPVRHTVAEHAALVMSRQWALPSASRLLAHVAELLDLAALLPVAREVPPEGPSADVPRGGPWAAETSSWQRPTEPPSRTTVVQRLSLGSPLDIELALSAAVAVLPALAALKRIIKDFAKIDLEIKQQRSSLRADVAEQELRRTIAELERVKIDRAAAELAASVVERSAVGEMQAAELILPVDEDLEGLLPAEG